MKAKEGKRRMCTCMKWANGDSYFGRTLDLDYRFGEQVAITPRGYPFKLKSGEEIRTRHAIIGMARVVGRYPLYADAMNEKGLALAALNFPRSAHYSRPAEGKLNLATFELFPYFLGLFSSVREARPILEKLNITNVTFIKGLPLAGLHWMMSDPHESIVIEAMKDGLHVYDDPVGILTNEPSFDFHLRNLSRYLHLSPKFPRNSFAPSLDLDPGAQGYGALGLPGDYSPPSRFVKAAFLKLNSRARKDELSSIGQFFHVLDAVGMVRGSVVTDRGRTDESIYSCCMNLNRGIYYYKTYANSRITAVKLDGKNLEAKALCVFALRDVEDVRNEN